MDAVFEEDTAGEPPRTVLVFAHECAPYHRPSSTAGAQRPAQFAKHLPASGWRAIVLCCDFTRREQGTPEDFERLPATVAAQLRAAGSDRSVVIAIPSWPCDGLLDRWWRTLVPKNGHDTLWRRTLRKPLTAAKFLSGDYSQPWQPFARRAAEAVSAAVKVDACIGEHGPDAGLFLARWFSKRFDVPWIADFRDPILRPFHGLARAIYEPRARRLLATASAIVEVTPAWAVLAAREFGRPSYAIPNGFDPDDFERGTVKGSPENGPNQRLVIGYSGHIHPVERLQIFFAGLALLRERAPATYKDVLFRYRGSSTELVRRLAADSGVSDVVHLAPHIERSAALRELSRSDLLLLLSVAEPQSDRYLRPGLYPAKAFEYFGVRRPILCVPGDGGLLDELIQTTGTGAICRTPEEIATHLVAAWGDWQAGRPLLYAPNDAAVTTYTRGAGARRLAEVLRRVAATNRETGGREEPLAR